METDDRISVEFVGNIPKQPMPIHDDDWATVDFDVGVNQTVILGYVRNEGGDSSHELVLDEVRIDADEPAGVNTLFAELWVRRRDTDLVLSGRSFYPYRIFAEIEPPLPERYVVKHFDEDGNQQFEGTEVFMGDVGRYQTERFEN